VDNPFLAGPHRARSRALTAIAAVVLIAVAALAVRLTFAHADQTRPSTSDSHQVGTSSRPLGSGDPHQTTPRASATASPSSSSAGLPIRLVKGSRQANGVWVGYPHTLVGAVSAYVEYGTQMLSNLDLQRAVDIGRVITDGSYGPPENLVSAPIGLRRLLGLPTSGPVPLGCSVTFTPVAYQIRNETQDRMTVLLLAYLTSQTPNEGLKTRIGVYPLPMAWASGDWKAAKPASDAPDFLELRVEPATPQAAAAGWLDFLQ
jgi:hypothetical protein